MKLSVDLAKLLKATRKNWKPLGKATLKYGAVGSAAGIASTAYSSSSHERDDNIRSGKKVGAFTGAALGAAAVAGSVVFRKIRGRIIPIRKKRK